MTVMDPEIGRKEQRVWKVEGWMHGREGETLVRYSKEMNGRRPRERPLKC